MVRAEVAQLNTLVTDECMFSVCYFLCTGFSCVTSVTDIVTVTPPPKVLVSGAFQSDLRECWHNSYMILRIGFILLLLLYTWRATCPFDTLKMLLEAYSTKCP